MNTHSFLLHLRYSSVYSRCDKNTFWALPVYIKFFIIFKMQNQNKGTIKSILWGLKNGTATRITSIMICSDCHLWKKKSQEV